MSEKRRSRVVEPRLRALNMRTTEALRAHLEQAAAASGRTLCAEVEHRLEVSFAEDRMRAIAREEMDARFGKQMTAEERRAYYDKYSEAATSLNGQIRQMFARA